MKTRAVLVGLVVLSCIACILTPATAKPAGEGAFLSEYASNVSQVIDQTQGNRLVALRYAKHFGSDPSSVLMFFRNELVVDTLEEDVTVQMYFLDASRNIVSKTIDFKAGTKVFANRAGAPILQIGTGNPLAPVLSTAPPIKPSGNTIVERVLDQPPTEISPLSAASEEAARAAPPLDNGTMVASVPAAAAAASVASGAGSASVSGWVLPLGLAGAAVALAGGGSGGSGSIDNQEQGPVVPEPASLVMLGSGLVAVSGFIVRRRR